MRIRILTLLVSFCLSIAGTYAQTPGIIVRPAGTAGPAVLDPNGDGYTSSSTAGFGNNDISNSEILYKVVAPLAAEPTGDLLRGPSGSFSDIVKTLDGSGFYLFSNGTNILCRLRIGGIVSGSKGYSILLDTDQKFGPSGPYADPNFQAATTGNNGNPGFEYEIVLETNFRIAVYNVDGTSTPAFVTSYPIATHSQISVATTVDGGNADYFYDFYVPYSVMGLSATSPIRAIATTVMCPCPAIGGPKSDIYGLSGSDYMSDWINFILRQPVFTPNDITSGGGGIGPKCTEPPVLNAPASASATSVTGTWTKSSYSTVSTATINLYKGATLLGSTSVASGNSWSIPVSGLANNDVLIAFATATGESTCLSSNAVTITSCTNSTHSTTPVVTCSSTRGFEGTMLAGTAVKLYRLTSTGLALYADDLTTTYKITYPTSTTWRYDDLNTQSGSACTGGSVDVPAGAYVVTGTIAGSCESNPLQVCVGGTTAPATPNITSALAQGATMITGTTAANAGVNLWINGYFIQSVVSNASGVFSFTLTKALEVNQPVEINAATTGSCASTSFTGTATCYVAAPVITANSSNQVSIGSQLSGTSGASTGSTITVYNASTLVSVGTTTVQANGSWTLSSPVVAASTSYLARLTGTSCGTSNASNTVSAVTATGSARCGTITNPINDTATTVSGTVTTAVAGTTVILYVDGVAAGSVVTAGTSWTIPVNTTVNNRIYAGAVLTIGINETGKTEVICTASVTVNCVAPVAPSVSPTSSSILVGQSVTYTVSSSVPGIMYSIRDNADAANLGESKFGNGGDLVLTTNAFSSTGFYTVRLKATSFSGPSCISSSTATVLVSGVLPLTLVDFNGRVAGSINKLSWSTTFEQNLGAFEIERSYDGRNFITIGTVQSSGNSSVMNNYQFDDQQPGSKLVYYRLKINEQNGTSYSRVIMLRSDKGISITQLGPNPFREKIFIGVDVMHNSNLSISIKDVTGRTMLSKNFEVRTGANSLNLDGLSKFSSGTYIIEISSGNERIEKRILIKK